MEEINSWVKREGLYRGNSPRFAVGSALFTFGVDVAVSVFFARPEEKLWITAEYLGLEKSCALTVLTTVLNGLKFHRPIL